MGVFFKDHHQRIDLHDKSADETKSSQSSFPPKSSREGRKKGKEGGK